jgi:hypothetical protein
MSTPDTLEYRVGTLEKQADLAARIVSLEKQAADLNSYLKAAVIIAAVFGLSGAWGLNALTQARDQLAGASHQIDALNLRANVLASGLAKTSEGVASLGTPEAITKRVDAVVAKVASPDVISNRVTEAIRTQLTTSRLNETLNAWPTLKETVEAWPILKGTPRAIAAMNNRFAFDRNAGIKLCVVVSGGRYSDVSTLSIGATRETCRAIARMEGAGETPRILGCLHGDGTIAWGSAASLTPGIPTPNCGW